MIAFENISYSIGKLQILGGVSCTAHPGDFLAILGPNGSGKSTLLRIAAGDLKPSHGSLKIFGKSYTELSLPEAARVRAVLSQHWQSSFPFEVRDIIMMGRYPHFESVPSAPDIKWVEKASELAGVSHLLQRKFTQLSGGEQQRVQFARVLAQVSCGEERPGILLLDEPTSSLDLKFQLELMRILKGLCHKGFTVVTVLHDLNLANRFSNHLLFLKRGMRVACGAPSEILSAEVLSEVYEIESSFFIESRLATC